MFWWFLTYKCQISPPGDVLDWTENRIKSFKWTLSRNFLIKHIRDLRDHSMDLHEVCSMSCQIPTPLQANHLIKRKDHVNRDDSACITVSIIKSILKTYIIHSYYYTLRVWQCVFDKGSLTGGYANFGTLIVSKMKYGSRIKTEESI